MKSVKSATTRTSCREWIKGNSALPRLRTARGVRLRGHGGERRYRPRQTHPVADHPPLSSSRRDASQEPSPQTKRLRNTPKALGVVATPATPKTNEHYLDDDHALAP